MTSRGLPAGPSSRHTASACSPASTATRRRGGTSAPDRVPLERAGHAARAAPPPAELAPGALDDLHPLLAQERVGLRVALVGQHHPRLQGQQVAAVVPLLPGSGAGLLARGEAR